MSDFIFYVIGFIIFLAIDVLLIACLHFSEHAAVSLLFLIALLAYNGISMVALMLHLLQPNWLKKMKEFI